MLLQSDYHIHAAFYRIKKPGEAPGPTLAEQVRAARAAGSKMLGILEHCNSAEKHPFSCLEQLAAEYHSYKDDNVFLGVEADLSEGGNDYCGPEGRKALGLDYVIASAHLSPKIIPRVEDYVETEFRWVLAALQNNSNVNIIGHPFGEGVRYQKAGIIQKWGFHLVPKEYTDALIQAALKNGKALEVNRCNPHDPEYIDFLIRLRDAGAMFSVGSDAHTTNELPQAAIRTKLLQDLGFKEEKHWRPDRCS